MKAAAIQATFATYRPVAGRKVLQLVMEVPIEAQQHVFAALGYPVPDQTLWVGIARLDPNLMAQQEAEPPAIEHQPEPELPKRKSLAQIAGILCSSKAFQKWSGNATADEAAEWLRGHCNITSRSQLDTNEDAAAIFRDMRGDFDAWMLAPEAYSPRGVAA